MGGTSSFSSVFAGIAWGIGTVAATFGLCILLWAKALALMMQAILSSMLLLTLFIVYWMIGLILMAYLGLLAGALFAGGIVALLFLRAGKVPGR